MTEQESFVACARKAVPGLTITRLSRLIGVSRQAIYQNEFSVESAVERWNTHPDLPRLRYLPARVVREQEESPHERC